MIGALQLYAGRGLRDRQHRLLAIVSAALGAYGSRTALCLPASALLAVGVAFVLIDPEVKHAFGDSRAGMIFVISSSPRPLSAWLKERPAFAEPACGTEGVHGYYHQYLACV